MPALQLGTSNEKRAAYGLPPARFINMSFEQTPQGPAPVARISRGGLVGAYGLGSGPWRALFQVPGVFDGDVFGVSGLELYRGVAPLQGALGNGLPRFATSGDQVAMTVAGILYVYDGSTVTIVTAFSDTSDPVPLWSDVAYLAGRFVLLVQGSTTFYWSDLDDGTAIQSLSFANTESSPDPNVALIVLGDQLSFLGSIKTEFWQASGDASAPYVRVTGRLFERGCGAQGSTLIVDNTYFWVGDDRVVYRAGVVPNRISTHSVEETLKNADLSNLKSWTITQEGHLYYGISIPDEITWVYDVSTGQWAQWDSYGLTEFRGCVGLTTENITYFGDIVSDQIWTLNIGTYTDGDDPIIRVVPAFFSIPAGSLPNYNTQLFCRPGVGLTSGQGENPIVEMRYSDTQGLTWSDWMESDLGTMGDYKPRAVWYRLGIVNAPGRYYEFRCSDPVNFTVEYANRDEYQVA